MRYFLICEREELGLENSDGGGKEIIWILCNPWFWFLLFQARRRKKRKVCFKRRKQDLETPQTSSVFMFELGNPNSSKCVIWLLELVVILN